MGTQLEQYNEIMRCWGKIWKELPDEIGAEDAFVAKAYKDGALSSKVKHLMALAVALRAGCEGCTISHTKQAVGNGATKAEVMEAVVVAVAMGGTPAGSWAWRVVNVLEELGKW